MSGDRLNIAVVGGGVAGVVAAHLLARRHDVTLLERNTYVGGHTATITIEDGPDAGTPVDTGFIVMNDKTYPTLHRFLEILDVPVRWSDMSFGFHDERTGLQYAGTSLAGLFAQRANMVNPRFLSFVLEIGRFAKVALARLEDGSLAGRSMREFVEREGFSEFLVRNYVMPMGAAIWSTPAGRMMEFPAETMMRFFWNHGLLSFKDRPRWQTVVGGSHAYIKAFLKTFPGRVETSRPAKSIRRTESGARVVLEDGTTRDFDRVVVATHADEAYALLADPTPLDTELLGVWRYNRNRTVLHTDEGVLPPLRSAWASWNYVREANGDEDAEMSMTYDMNRLQGLRCQRQYCVTLNRRGPIRPERILREFVYTHPIYTLESLRAQSRLAELNHPGAKVLFAGSYFGYGFHEDATKAGAAIGRLFGEEL